CGRTAGARGGRAGRAGLSVQGASCRGRLCRRLAVFMATRPLRYFLTSAPSLRGIHQRNKRRSWLWFVQARALDAAHPRWRAQALDERPYGFRRYRPSTVGWINLGADQVLIAGVAWLTTCLA